MSKNIAQEQVGSMVPPQDTTYNMLIEMLLLTAEKWTLNCFYFFLHWFIKTCGGTRLTSFGYLPTCMLQLPFFFFLALAVGCSRRSRIPAAWKGSYYYGFPKHIAFHLNSYPTCRVYNFPFFVPQKLKWITYFLLCWVVKQFKNRILKIIKDISTLFTFCKS